METYVTEEKKNIVKGRNVLQKQIIIHQLTWKRIVVISPCIFNMCIFSYTNCLYDYNNFDWNIKCTAIFNSKYFEDFEAFHRSLIEHVTSQNRFN
jgi:hypothetical protein